MKGISNPLWKTEFIVTCHKSNKCSFSGKILEVWKYERERDVGCERKAHQIRLEDQRFSNRTKMFIGSRKKNHSSHGCEKDSRSKYSLYMIFFVNFFFVKSMPEPIIKTSPLGPHQTAPLHTSFQVKRKRKQTFDTYLSRKYMRSFFQSSSLSLFFHQEGHQISDAIKCRVEDILDEEKKKVDPEDLEKLGFDPAAFCTRNMSFLVDFVFDTSSQSFSLLFLLFRVIIHHDYISFC